MSCTLNLPTLIPQLFMFQRQVFSCIELLIVRFVVALGFSRVMEFFFWIYSYHQLANSASSQLPSYYEFIYTIYTVDIHVGLFWY